VCTAKPSAAVEQLRFEEALLQHGPYRRALPAALANASGCRVLESHGDQVGHSRFAFESHDAPMLLEWCGHCPAAAASMQAGKSCSHTLMAYCFIR
jgi:hypothetical protein